LHIKENTPMTLSESAINEILAAINECDGTDLVRQLAQFGIQELIEAEATEAIGAGVWERSPERSTHRNGHRQRTLSTKAGDLELGIPKFRKGAFFPEILEPRRRIDQAMYAVVMDAYVNGVSTRSVDALVAALGVDTGISKSEVSRICAGLDERVNAFRNRTLGHAEFPYIYLDATYIHVSDDALGQVVSRAACDLRRPRRPQESNPALFRRRFMAAMPGALRPQPARQRPQEPGRVRRCRVPIDLRARHR
jgi:putative transposase